MLSVYVVCWIFLQTFQTYFCIQANSVDPDQTAPRGAVWSGSILFANMTFEITSRWQKADSNCCDWQFKGYRWNRCTSGWLVGLEFNGLVNTIKVMWSQSVYLTTTFPGHALSSMWLTSTYAHSFILNWQLPFLNQWKVKNDRRKYLMINFHERMLPDSWRSNQWLLITSQSTSDRARPDKN